VSVAVAGPERAEPVRALRFKRSVPRFLAARAVGARVGAVAQALAPLSFDELDPLPLPGAGWVRVRPLLAGICGSDVATVHARTSFYFGPIVSTPFVLGHEIVGVTEGRRVVIRPSLGCAVRGIEPPCRRCQAGDASCERVAFGHLAPGLQTGFCADTGGGWSTGLLAHESQLHDVPADLSDEAAVLIEPLACAVRAVRTAAAAPGDLCVILGAGAVGLLVFAALRHLSGEPVRTVVVAKHARQAAEARRLGAETVVPPRTAARHVRRLTRSDLLEPEYDAPYLSGGADVAFECTGAAATLADAMRLTRPRGTVVLAGMPAPDRLDLTPAWHRELTIRGAYAAGPADVEAAFEIARTADLAPLVGPLFPLARWREAIDHAANAGRLGAIKVAFDVRDESKRESG